MREIIKLTLELTLICAICAGLLSFVSVKTQSVREGIAEKKLVKSAVSVLPGTNVEPERMEVNGQTVFTVRSPDGTISAAAIECTSQNGYGGEIRLVVGFKANGEVNDFAVLKSTETPGLGSKISSKSFAEGIRGKSISSNWHVKKDGGDIDAITSATISSRAVCEAIASAVETFKVLTGTGK